VYAVIKAVADVLVAAGEQPDVFERELRDVRRRIRLNETAPQVTGRLEHDDEVALWILDVVRGEETAVGAALAFLRRT
jgi:hypothetical protein